MSRRRTRANFWSLVGIVSVGGNRRVRRSGPQRVVGVAHPREQLNHQIDEVADGPFLPRVARACAVRRGGRPRAGVFDGAVGVVTKILVKWRTGRLASRHIAQPFRSLQRSPPRRPSWPRQYDERILDALDEPGSATAVARSLGLSRQQDRLSGAPASRPAYIVSSRSRARAPSSGISSSARPVATPTAARTASSSAPIPSTTPKRKP